MRERERERKLHFHVLVQSLQMPVMAKTGPCRSQEPGSQSGFAIQVAGTQGFELFSAAFQSVHWQEAGTARKART